MNKNTNKMAVTALAAAMVIPVFSGTLANTAYAEEVKETQEVEANTSFQVKKNIINIVKGESLPDLMKNVDEYFVQEQHDGVLNPVVAATIQNGAELEESINDENTPLGYYKASVEVQLKDGDKAVIPFMVRTVEKEEDKTELPIYAKTSVKKGEALPNLNELIEVKGADAENQKLVYDESLVNTEVEGNYIVPVEIKTGEETVAKIDVIVSVKANEEKEEDETTDVTVSEDDKTEKVYVVTNTNLVYNVGDEVKDLKEVIKVADAEGKTVAVKEIAIDEGQEIDTSKEGEGVVPVTVTFEDDSQIKFVANYKVNAVETEEDTKAKELEEAKEKAIKELQEAGITSDFFLNRIRSAKTIEGVESLKAELLASKEDKPSDEETEKGYDTREEAEEAAQKALENDPINKSYKVSQGKDGKFYFQLSPVEEEKPSDDNKDENKPDEKTGYVVSDVKITVEKGDKVEVPAFEVKDKDGKAVEIKSVEYDKDLNKINQEIGTHKVVATITLANGEEVQGNLYLTVEEKAEEGQKPKDNNKNNNSGKTNTGKVTVKEKKDEKEGYKLETKEVKIKKGEKLPKLEEYIRVLDKNGKEVAEDDIKKITYDETKVDTERYGEYSVPVTVKLEDKDIELKGNVKVKVTDENGNIPSDTSSNERVKTGVAGSLGVAGVLAAAAVAYKKTKKED